MADALLFYTTDVRKFNFDYSNMPELVAGDTLASASVSASPSGLTLGSPSVSTTKVQVQLSGGTANTIYTITCLALTTAGLTLTGKGQLAVA